MLISDWSSDVCSSDLLPDDSRGLGAEIEQGPDGPAGALAGAQFQHLSEQHQHDDDCRRLVIDADVAVGVAEAGREDLRRSEEHTSELQSLMRISYAVFCLKQKKTHNQQRKHTPVETSTIIENQS